MSKVKVKLTQSRLTLCDPKEFSRPEYWSGQPFPSPGDLPNSGIKPRSPTLWTDSLPAEPQGKPKNTGVVSLSLLQWIFQTQESNQGLLHYRWVLYQLSYQGNLELQISYSLRGVLSKAYSIPWMQTHANQKRWKELASTIQTTLNTA